MSEWRHPATTALAGLGLAISAYLTAVHYSGGPVICVGTGGCAVVQASRYAVVAGIPIALLGGLLYLGLLGLSLWRLRARFATPTFVPMGIFGLALAGTLYSGYLTYLELFVIGAICTWCVGSAILVTAIAVLAAWDLSRGETA